MHAIVPLYQPPSHPDWKALEELISSTPGAGNQTTVIINPASGPGPDRQWAERQHWLGLMARLLNLRCRLALYLSAQEAQLVGRRWELTRRTPAAITADIKVWKKRWLSQLGSGADRCVWWIDHHPCQLDGLLWAEMVSLYSSLGKDAHAIANVRTIPSPEFVRACPAKALCVHAGNGWPPTAQPTMGGKPTAIIACNLPGLTPGANRAATYLYAHPAEHSGGTFTTLSPHLARILALS